MNTVVLILLIIQSIITVISLYISISTLKKFDLFTKKQQSPNRNYEINIKKIENDTLNSNNTNEIIKIDSTENQQYIFGFVSPGCTACKDLFNGLPFQEENKKRLIIVSPTDQNVEEYNNFFKERNVPVIISKNFADKLGVKAFPTVIHVDEKLSVKDYFIGSNKSKLIDLMNVS